VNTAQKELHLDRLRIFLSNIRLGISCLLGTNTLAYLPPPNFIFVIFCSVVNINHMYTYIEVRSL